MCTCARTATSLPWNSPCIPGNEVLGTAPDGRRLVGLTQGGGYAEQAHLHRRVAWEVPDDITDDEAICLALQGQSAWHLLFTAADVKAGDRVVIPAAGGGLGSIAVQFAKQAGATVIALASTEDKRRLASDLGADAVVDSTADDLTEAIVVLGPGEYVGRLPWWLHRARRGGRMLAPGRPETFIQPVDVRDVAAFAVDQAAAATAGGAFNIAGPLRGETMDGFLRSCLAVTGGRGELVWVPDEVLVRHGVREWTELPLWRTAAGAWAVDSARAHAAGLRCRPLPETVADTWAWLTGGGVPVDHPRSADHGIAEDKETRILAEALGDRPAD